MKNILMIITLLSSFSTIAQINTFSGGEKIEAQKINDNFTLVKPFFKEAYVHRDSTDHSISITNSTSGMLIHSSILEFHSPDGLKIACYDAPPAAVLNCGVPENELIGIAANIVDAGSYEVCASLSLRISNMSSHGSIKMARVDQNRNILEGAYSNSLFYNNNALELISEHNICGVFNLIAGEHIFSPVFYKGTGTVRLDVGGPNNTVNSPDNEQWNGAVRFTVERK